MAVAAGDARHGRRDNGLVAAEYVPAGDVDPRVGEHLLDVLALDGIAAYLRPSTDLHPVTRSNLLPDRPTDRLFVDRAHLATARRYLASLAAETPGTGGAPSAPGDAGGAGDGGETDVEAEWARIVARFDVESPRRAWPDAEDVTEPGPHAAGVAGQRPPAPEHAWPPHGAATTDEPSLLDALDTFGADLPDDDESGYTPPAPPPLPRPSLPTALGVAGVLGGLIVFLRPDLLPVAEGTALLAGFAAVLAGFVTLVWRLRPGDEEADDPDDGARV